MRKYAKPIDGEVFDKIDKTKRKKTNDQTESFHLQKKKPPHNSTTDSSSIAICHLQKISALQIVKISI